LSGDLIGGRHYQEFVQWNGVFTSLEMDRLKDIE
jgi:hypothetical protein